jgi:hypothetical protein
MSRTGNRKKLGESLDRAEDERVEAGQRPKSRAAELHSE